MNRADASVPPGCARRVPFPARRNIPASVLPLPPSVEVGTFVPRIQRRERAARSVTNSAKSSRRARRRDRPLDTESRRALASALRGRSGRVGNRRLSGGGKRESGAYGTELTEGAKGVSQYPLGITVIPGDRLELMFGYHPELYDGTRIGEVKAALVDILEAIARGAAS